MPGDIRIGSICTGAGGLDMAVQSIFGGQVAWVSDVSPEACKLAAHRWPDLPNLGDITRVPWYSVPTVDIICGGTPCQDMSSAGQRKGMTTGARSGLWTSMKEAINVIKPAIVVWENVPGARSARADSDLESGPGRVGEDPGQPVLRALGRVLGDLATLGFDAEWRSIRASDLGFSHRRDRVFVLAWHPGRMGALGWDVLKAGTLKGNWKRYPAGPTLLPTPCATSGNGASRHGDGAPDLGWVVTELEGVSPYGRYAEAVARQERVTGLAAPPPTDLNRNGGPRLSARFCEWMMGLQPGWVCDVPGVLHQASIRLIGNGVVPHQARAALAEMAAVATQGKSRRPRQGTKPCRHEHLLRAASCQEDRAAWVCLQCSKVLAIPPDQLR